MAVNEAVWAVLLRRWTGLGSWTVLVNHAGMAIFGPFEQTTTEVWPKTMGTHLDGVYFGCREALPHLSKMKGCVINLSSASGLGGDWA